MATPRLIRDLFPGGAHGVPYDSLPFQITAFGDWVYFEAQSTDVGRRVWKSDGIVIDLVGDDNSDLDSPREFQVAGGRIFFHADDDEHGRELWSTDGSDLRMTPEFLIGRSSSFVADNRHNFTSLQGHLFFSMGQYDPQQLGLVGLWRSDGFSNERILSTTSIKISLAPPISGNSIFAGYLEPKPSNIFAFGTNIYFAGTHLDPSNKFEVFGNEIWRYNLVTDITTPVVDINRTEDHYSNSNNPDEYTPDFTAIGTNIFFVAQQVPISSSSSDGIAPELWIIENADGNQPVARRIRSFNAQGFFPLLDLTAAGDTLFFWQASTLWKCSPDATGKYSDAVPVKSFEQLAPVAPKPTITAVGERIYFIASDQIHDFELWTSDGSESNTLMVKDINISNDLNIFHPLELTAVGRTLYFTANDGVHGRELWRSNGSSESTFMVMDINATPNSNGGTDSMNDVDISQVTHPADLTLAGNQLFFAADDGIHGVEPWALDVSADVQILHSIHSVSSSSKAEGDSGTTNLEFTVKRTGVLDRQTSVSYVVTGAGNNPANAQDFGGTFPSGKIDFGIGEWRQTITIPVLGDTQDEPDEGFSIQLLSTDPDEIDSQSGKASGSILNDDAILTITGTALSTRTEGYGYLESGNDFLFTVTRSSLSSLPVSASWSVTPGASNPTSSNDFVGNIYPSGSVLFMPDQLRTTIAVAVRRDTNMERDESFVVSLTSSNNAKINPLASKALGLVINDDLTGTDQANNIVATTSNEYINGFAGADLVTGAAGADIFAVHYGHSPIPTGTMLTFDRITDFEVGLDRIEPFNPLLSPVGGLTEFTRAATNSTASNFTQLAQTVFTDANGRLFGNQSLKANAAALVVATHPAISGTYIFINDGQASLLASNDTLISITGYRGKLPDLGAIPVNSFFSSGH